MMSSGEAEKRLRHHSVASLHQQVVPQGGGSPVGASCVVSHTLWTGMRSY